MRDDTCLRRQWLLLRALTARRLGMTVREMAAETGVNEKTIRRDIDTFRSVGFPLEETVGEFGRKTWRIAPSSSQPPLSFTFEEAAALYLGRRFLEPLAGTIFWQAALCAFQKIRATLGDQPLEYLERFGSIFHCKAFGSRDYSKRSEVIEALQIGLEDRKAIQILYQSDHANSPTYRDVYPYGLVFNQHRSSLYLVAFDPREQKIKIYKVDRIEAAEVGQAKFERPAEFNANAYLATTFGVHVTDGEPATVRIRFTADVARYVQEAKWHSSQRLTPEPDGSLVAEYSLASTVELRGWILSFASKALVLEPESLRSEIAAEVRALCAAYESPDVPSRKPGGPRSDRHGRRARAAGKALSG